MNRFGVRLHEGRVPPGRNLRQSRRWDYLDDVQPVLSFPNPEEYVRVLKDATQREFDIEEREIGKFSETEFDCWPLLFKECGTEFHEWIVVVRTEGATSHEVFPEPGEHCGIRFNVQIPGVHRQDPKWLKCTRIGNPVHNFALKLYGGIYSWASFTTFQVDIPSYWGHLDPKPFDVLPLKRYPNEKLPAVSLTSETRLPSSLLPRISETTKSVELEALRDALEVSRPALLYLSGFENPMYHTNLFDQFPYMQYPNTEGSQLLEACKRWFGNLHADQKRTYSTVLASLSCGIGFIHGASGTGKTHLALTIAAMAQAVPMALETVAKPPQVLFLMAKNRPLTDATNKMVEIYKQLGMNDIEYMRMYNFNYEAEYSSERIEKRLPSSGAEDNQKAKRVDFEAIFAQTRPVYAPQIRTGRRTDCLAPTLREACEKVYTERHQQEDLAILNSLHESDESQISEDEKEQQIKQLREKLKKQWRNVVIDTLASTHFIATTPVGASKMASFANGVFDPAIVIIDDASEVREASTLVALASFSPKAVLLVGDIHQPGPWVGNFEEQNPYDQQLRISTMERHWAKAARSDLTVNHRALGNLHELCSDLWYGGMTSAVEASQRFPPPTVHLCLYLQQLTGAAQIDIPRILVHVPNSLTKLKRRSKFNPAHQKWVMGRVNELIHDPDFRSVDGKERGSILIMTPYRAATNFYREAVDNLLCRLDRERRETQDGRSGMHQDVRVDVRTIDSSQGSEADIAILDLVHRTTTTHIVNSKRLCVAMTRARQAEIIVMQRGMLVVGDEGCAFRNQERLDKSLIGRIHEHCQKRGQVFTIDRDAEAKTTVVKLPKEHSNALRGHQRALPANGGFDAHLEVRSTTRPSPPHSPGQDGYVVLSAPRIRLPPSPNGESNE